MRISIKRLRQIIREEVNKQDPSSYVPWAEEARKLDGEIRKAREEYAGWYKNMTSKPDWYKPSFLKFFEIPEVLRGRDHAVLIRSKIGDIDRYYSDTTEGQEATGYLKTLLNALDAHVTHVDSLSEPEQEAFGDWALDNRPDLMS